MGAGGGAEGADGASSDAGRTGRGMAPTATCAISTSVSWSDGGLGVAGIGGGMVDGPAS